MSARQSSTSRGGNRVSDRVSVTSKCELSPASCKSGNCAGLPKVGDPARVFCRSSRSWVSGTVVKVEGNHVRVEYETDHALLGKDLHIRSEHLDIAFNKVDLPTDLTHAARGPALSAKEEQQRLTQEQNHTKLMKEMKRSFSGKSLPGADANAVTSNESRRCSDGNDEKRVPINAATVSSLYNVIIQDHIKKKLGLAAESQLDGMIAVIGSHDIYGSYTKEICQEVGLHLGMSVSQNTVMVTGSLLGTAGEMAKKFAEGRKRRGLDPGVFIILPAVDRDLGERCPNMRLGHTIILEDWKCLGFEHDSQDAFLLKASVLIMAEGGPMAAKQAILSQQPPNNNVVLPIRCVGGYGATVEIGKCPFATGKVYERSELEKAWDFVTQYGNQLDVSQDGYAKKVAEEVGKVVMGLTGDFTNVASK